MKPPAWTFCLVAMLGACVPAAERPAAAPGKGQDAPAAQADSRPATGPAREAAPITPPQFLKKPGGSTVPLLPESTPLVDQVCRIEKDFTRQQWVIQDSRVGQLYLLPCETLEAVEAERAASPAAVFRLSGEIYGYRGAYYLMLRSAAMLMTPATTTSPAGEKPPAEEGPASLPTTTAPAADEHPSSEDVARELMRQMPPKPILPKAPPRPTTGAAPAASPKSPLRPGPGRIVVNRLTRLAPPKATAWFRLTFEADNTLREPPLRILPSKLLETMERLSAGGTAPGARFHVSGEVHHYRGRNYILLRAVLPKRELGQF